MSSTERTERRLYGVAAVGEERWYWVVWPSLAELQASCEAMFIIAEGSAATEAKADAQALNMAGRHARCVAAKYARAHFERHSSDVQSSKQQDTAGAPAAQAFLYRETYDPERVTDLFTQLSRFSNKAFYMWEKDQGLHRIGASHIKIPRTASAKELLTHIEGSKHFGVYILRDFNDALEDEKNIQHLLKIASGDVNSFQDILWFSCSLFWLNEG